MRLEVFMEEIAISKFKATCLAVLERVRVTNQPIRVTRFGKPMAEIRPPAPTERPRRRFGMGKGKILGDIVGPVMDESDFEAAQEGPAVKRPKEAERKNHQNPDIDPEENKG
jgi:antitoxin (DNA-binding transcriptional repressor) of toxin-antitoxin stability system